MSTAIIIDDSGSTGIEVGNKTILDVIKAVAMKLLSSNPSADAFSMTDLANGVAKPLSKQQIISLRSRGGTPLHQAIAQAKSYGYDHFYLICDGAPDVGLTYPPSPFVVRGLDLPPVEAITSILVVEDPTQIVRLLEGSDNLYEQTLIAAYVADKW